MDKQKPKLAMYWAASCGGCEISVVNTHEFILELDQHFNFFFCPCLLDAKRADLEALDDNEIALTLFNGALRTEENLEMARLLRKKSEILIAFGSCATTGGIPALANQRTLSELCNTVYTDAPGLDAAGGQPAITSIYEGFELSLPPLLPKVQTLADQVAVDYFMPGCPPEPEQIVAVLQHLISGQPLPPRGAWLGCSQRAVCDECPREKRDHPVAALVRPGSRLPEPGWCLLEQGFVCLGSATRGGCKGLCPSVNMPCSGCYGPVDLVRDPGTTSLVSVTAVLAPSETRGSSDAEIQLQQKQSLLAVPDPLGSFYRYTLSKSRLQNAGEQQCQNV
jgi:F420-non-reducing hydrogenase small subunit